MTEFQLLDIRSKFHGKMIISYYTHRHSCACSKESDETEHSIHGTEASWKLKARPTACAVSHLTHLARENVTTNVTRGGRVYSYRVQATHTVHCVSAITADWTTVRSRVTAWQVMAQALKWPGRVGGSMYTCSLGGPNRRLNLWGHNGQAQSYVTSKVVTGRIKTKLGLMLLARKGPIFFSAFKTDQPLACEATTLY